jgi:alcohol dehydrogenase
MRAVTYEAFAGPVEVTRVRAPVPPPHGVVLAVEAAGLCRSDWHGWQGHDPDIRAFPHVPGHELAGTILAVGAAVRRWRVGDRVTAPFVCGCGACAACARGDQQVCAHQTQPGFTHWGAFAEQVAIHHADVNLVALPEHIAFATAASLGCRFATSFRAMVDQGRVQPDEWVAVFGCGGVGLSAVMIARALGARPIAVDLRPGARALALELGAEVALDGSAGAEVVAAIHDLTSGGADLTCDALGSAQTAADALRSLRTNGRHVQVGLLAGAEAEPRLPLHLLIGRELTIVGSHGMAAHAYPRMLAMIADGRLDPARLVTRTIGLDAVPEALMTMDSAPHPGVTVILPG